VLAVDTNIVIRYLVRDDDRQSARAREIIHGSPVFVSLTVLLESEWVLRSLYGFGQSEVLTALEAFCGTHEVSVAEPAVVKQAFVLSKLGLELADALHVAQSDGCEAFVTFDKRLVKRMARATGARVRLA
jgi:predicted nucleic-acid-binding protein